LFLKAERIDLDASIAARLASAGATSLL